jgi:hypothetical protein
VEVQVRDAPIAIVTVFAALVGLLFGWSTLESERDDVALEAPSVVEIPE